MNKLRKRNVAAALSLLTAISLANTGVAQSTTSPMADSSSDTTKLEKFEVTGSYLPMSALAPSIPVSTIDAAAIDDTGSVGSLLDALRKSAPQFTGNGNLGVNNANTGGNKNNGGSEISFRNLPTLVLLNGRRLPYSPVASTGGNLFVDVNMIPISAVERIEIVQDGGSALYGSDAIAGVVNIILKTDLQGFVLTGKYSVSPNKGNFEERLMSLAGGVSDGKSSITVAAEWYKADPLYLSERAFASPSYGTSSFGGILNIGGSYYFLNPSLSKPPAGSTPIATLVANGIYSGPYTSTAVQPFYNLAGPYGSTLQAGDQRKSVTAAFDHKINDNISFFGSTLASQTYTNYRLNAQPITATLAPGAVGNPTTSTITIRNRFYLFPRLYETTNNQLGLLAGLKGTFEGWKWEVAGNYGEVRQYFHNPNLIDNAALVADIAAGTLDLSSTAPYATDTAGIFGAAYVNQVSKLWTIDGKASGKVFSLPAGDVDLVVGGQLYRESLSADADKNSNVNTFDWNGGTAITPFVSARKVYSAFAELAIPITSPAMTVPGAYSLNLDGQVRHDAYSDTKKPTTPKYNIRWQPMDNQLSLRASWSTGFRAPKLYDLFGPANQGFTTTATYNSYNAAGAVTGTFAGQGHSQTGSNPTLGPSTSENFSGGLVYSPKQVRGLSFTADYFHVNEYNVVGTIGATNIIASVERYGAASPYANKVRLAPLGASNDPKWFTQGSLVTAPGQISTIGLDSTYVSDTNINLGGTKTDGVDVRINYTKAFDNIGRFDFNTTATIYNHYKIKNLITDPYTEYSNSVTGNYSTIPDWRTYTTLEYTRGSWKALIAHTFIPSVQDLTTLTPVGSYGQFDARLAYAFGSELGYLKGLSVSLYVNNVFNRYGPPSPSNTDTHVDTAIYGAIGRQYTLEANYKF